MCSWLTRGSSRSCLGLPGPQAFRVSRTGRGQTEQPGKAVAAVGTFFFFFSLKRRLSRALCEGTTHEVSRPPLDFPSPRERAMRLLSL